MVSVTAYVIPLSNYHEVLITLRCSKDKMTFVIVDNEILFFRQRDGPYYPTLRLLHKCAAPRCIYSSPTCSCATDGWCFECARCVGALCVMRTPVGAGALFTPIEYGLPVPARLQGCRVQPFATRRCAHRCSCSSQYDAARSS